jgi:hypothetical protein
MPSTFGASIQSIGHTFPGIREKTGATGAPALGFPVTFTARVGNSLLVDGVTYKDVLFIAPCDGCRIKELWATAAIAIAGGTSTLAIQKYDKSATTGVNALSTTNIDPTTVTVTAGFQLTLTTTVANLLMDEGDVLWATLVCGTMTTDGQSFTVGGTVIVPDLI